MRQRGRKSAASLSVVPIATDARRPPPPENLAAAEAKIWTAIVASVPGGWVTVAQEPLLTAYCRHVASGDTLSAMIDHSRPDWTCREELQRYSRLLGIRLRETSAMMSLATKMRLTQQSTMHPRTAGRAMTDDQGGPKLWERRPPWADEC